MPAQRDEAKARHDLGGMAARYRSGYLVSGGVERSLTQKPWRPGTPSPGNHSTSQTRLGLCLQPGGRLPTRYSPVGQ